ILSSDQLQSPIPDISKQFSETIAVEALTTFEYDVLIVVTSQHMNADIASLMQQFHRAGLAAEFMALGPACRTFNLLLAEGRKPLIWASV
ncbi:MAG: MTH938/NDUFAF3 family protein, partial [Methylophaga sp.]